ncbi:MAG: L-lactate permease, partial [Actinomycetota bacterium]
MLSIIWAALFLFHLVDETGQIQVIGSWLSRLAPDRPLRVLLLAWAFTSFLQGIAGYGVPVAVVAPLMAANGFTPFVAVVTTSIGH